MALAVLAAAPVAGQQAGSITGRITDAASGSALPSARVEVVAGARVVAAGVTDGTGTYRLDPVPPGTYALVVTLVGYEPQRVDGVRVVAGETTILPVALTSVAFRLNPVIVSASRRQEKVVEAPAMAAVIDERAVAERPALTPVDHLRGTAGLDFITYGLQSTSVVARGFNNVFSTALHTLTDYRIASVPSLRVNLLHLVPANNEDVERIEAVLGPGSALYGPNTANGVVHIITKSPLDRQGTTVAVAGGEQSVFQAEFRTAHRVGERLGLKLSGQYLSGEEWPYTDPIEVAARAEADAQPARVAERFRLACRSLDPELTRRCEAEIPARLARIGRRDFDLRRLGGEARVDWRPLPGLTAVFSAGLTRASRGIELTGIGAAQVRDWTYSYYQVRATYGRLFGQVYLNASDAGDTYLLRDGAAIVDNSKLFVAQLQHGFDLGARQSFTYGVDYLATRPDTRGTIHGANEASDDVDEYGAYLQSQTALGPRFDLVLAARVDKHSELRDAVFSPRAALVFRPAEEQSFRLAYNRAFSTPLQVNFFLDINAGPAPDARLAALGFGLRAQGTTRDGLRLHMPDGSLGMRSPFTPAGLGGPAGLLPATADVLAQYWPAAVQALAAQSAAAGRPLPPNVLSYLNGLRPTGADLGIHGLDLITRRTFPLEPRAVRDVPGIRESVTETLEAGYQGLLADRLMLSAAVWVGERVRFTSPLTAVTPLVLFDGPRLGAYLVPRLTEELVRAGMPPAQAQALATQVASGLAQIPLAVVSSPDVHATGADILASYLNFGNVNLWGADVVATALLSDAWQLAVGGSYVSEDFFETEGQIVTLNAPKTKASAALSYRNAALGLNGELRVRHTGGFPVNAAPFIGIRCRRITDPPTDECVKTYTLLDLTLGYRLPIARGPALQLSVQNLLDEEWQSFLGVPPAGRLAVLRLRYDF